MRRFLLILGLLGLATASHASSTLRVGSRVLTTGDSAVRVVELLGKPSYKTSRSGGRGGRGGRHGRRARAVNNRVRGQKWQYRRGDHVTTVTIVDGKVFDIEDRRR